MGSARAAPDVGTRRDAVGLDLGAPVLEVARRGFNSAFSNQMGQLGGWISSAPGGVAGSAEGEAPFTTVLHLTEDLAGVLAERDAGHSDRAWVGVAAPGWMGWCDRHHVAQLVDPHGVCQLVWVSTPVSAAIGTNAGLSSTLVPELVVAIDMDLGISGSVVSIDGAGVREVVASSVPPRWSSRPDSVDTVIDDIAEGARAAGMLGATRIVLVAEGAGSSTLVERAIRALDRVWGECPVDIVRSRAEIARATVMLADLDLDVVGAAPRSIGVLLDDDHTGLQTFHPILARNTPLPGRAAASFDLGPDDGAEVYLDVYEEHADVSGSVARVGDRRGHRLVMTARLDQVMSTPRADAIDVSFVVASDGLLRVEANTSGERPPWSCTWAASTVVMPGATQSAMARSSVAQLSRLLAVPTVTGSGPRPRHLTREMAPPIGLAEALGRAERLVSRQVGHLVAIRSAMALVGCGDRDDPAMLRDAADRLAAVLERCAGNDATPALQLALDVARRAFESPARRVFAAGSERDVARELERVVEHLAIVIGAVTPVERNRLVLDGQLLGLDHERARSLVDELIDDAGVDSDGQPDQLRDPTALVAISAAGFRVVPLGSALTADEAAIRVLLFEP